MRQVSQFLVEAVTLSLLGGIIAIMVGLAASWLISYLRAMVDSG